MVKVAVFEGERQVTPNCYNVPYETVAATRTKNLFYRPSSTPYGNLYDSSSKRLSKFELNIGAELSFCLCRIHSALYRKFFYSRSSMIPSWHLQFLPEQMALGLIVNFKLPTTLRVETLIAAFILHFSFPVRVKSIRHCGSKISFEHNSFGTIVP